jgi:negative regulator of sigma E activity
MSREILSAAIDDAATAAEWEIFLKAVDQDATLMREWSRHCHVRDAMAGVRVHARSTDFCAGVMNAIAAEPAGAESAGKVVDLATRRVGAAASSVAVPLRAGRRLRTLVPISAAAGVAAAVLTVNLMRTSEAPNTLANQSVTVAATPVSNMRTAGTDRPAAQSARVALLGSYLLEHNNSVAERGMGGSLANARFAARAADYRPDAE